MGEDKLKQKQTKNQTDLESTCAKLLQLCPTLGDSADCSLPGSSVQGDSPGKNTGAGFHALL